MSRVQYSKDNLLGALLQSAEESYLTPNEKDTLTVIVESAMDFIEGTPGRYSYIDEEVRACNEGDLSSWWSNEGGAKLALETMGLAKSLEAKKAQENGKTKERQGPLRRDAGQTGVSSPVPQQLVKP